MIPTPGLTREGTYHLALPTWVDKVQTPGRTAGRINTAHMPLQYVLKAVAVEVLKKLKVVPAVLFCHHLACVSNVSICQHC